MLKRANVCCAFRWSPPSLQDTYIAAGSIAGAMGEDFNTDAHLEIRRVDCSAPGDDMPVCGRVVMPDRVHRVDWSRLGSADGTIAVGYTDGHVGLWSAECILGGGDADASSMCNFPAHHAGVTGLQFNSLQPSFLATAGHDRELAVWSVEDPKEPKAVPALTKSTQATEITDTRWNTKYPHILATSTIGGNVSVWDLKAKRAAVSFSQASPANAIAWHSDVSTQIAVARDDGVVQIWDLKKAMAPIKELKAHMQSVLGLSWSSDGQLLLSCGSDGRTLCWDVVSGLSMGELPRQENWVFDVQWAPRTPAVLATASFDSSLSVHSAQQLGGPAARTPPKWLARPATVACGFGGIVAKVVPHPPHSVAIFPLPTVNEIACAEEAFRSAAESLPPNSAERAEWIRDQDEMLGALALSYATHHRRPMQEAVLRSAPPSDDPERLVARGELELAVDVCVTRKQFADAFAIAHLKGPELVARVQKAYLAQQRTTLSDYVRAISQQDYTALPTHVRDGTTHDWRECLSLLLSFASAEALTETSATLGAEQRDAGNKEAAAWAFVNAGNIDALVELWEQSCTLAELVHRVALFESTCEVQCQSPIYAAALERYAGVLAAAGDAAGAYRCAMQAQRLGREGVSTVVDRLRFRIDVGNAPFPFSFEPLPDATTPEMLMMGSDCVSTGAPTPSLPTPAPQAQPPTTQHKTAPVLEGSAPPPMGQTPMAVSPRPSQVDPPRAPAMPTHASSSPPPAEAPSTLPSNSAAPHARVPHADPRADSQAADPRTVPRSPGTARTIDTAGIEDPELRSLAQAVVAAAARIPERPRRERVERSAVELVDQLTRQRVPPEVLPSLVAFLRVAGTPSAKDAWRTLSDEHFAVCQPFANLKFL